MLKIHYLTELTDARRDTDELAEWLETVLGVEFDAGDRAELYGLVFEDHSAAAERVRRWEATQTA